MKSIIFVVTLYISFLTKVMAHKVEVEVEVEVAVEIGVEVKVEVEVEVEEKTKLSYLSNTISVYDINNSVTHHSIEKRGFISVPLDYKSMNTGNINIFYRLVPTTNINKRAPILAIINGGPGSSSWGYHPIDFDYANSSATSEISELRKYFRILLVDQRGTGYSAPLDLENPMLPADNIAKYFDYDDIAKDHERVINKIVPTGEDYFLLARSYGGVVGLEYLIKNYRKPKGFIFSSIIQPHMDPVEVFSKRREQQRTLNLVLQKKSPSTIKKINKLKNKLKKVGLEPERVNILWSYLGKSESWISILDTKLDHLLELNSTRKLERALSLENMSTVNLLNYVLSSKSLTPGYTDSTMTKETSAKVPFAEWMLDENWTLNQLGKDKHWKGKFITNVDDNPPTPSYFPSITKIRNKMRLNQVLFTFGKLDSFLNYDLMKKNALRFKTGSNVEFKTFEGGHGAVFSKAGANYLKSWVDSK